METMAHVWDRRFGGVVWPNGNMEGVVECIATLRQDARFHEGWLLHPLTRVWTFIGDEEDMDGTDMPPDWFLPWWVNAFWNGIAISDPSTSSVMVFPVNVLTKICIPPRRRNTK